MCAAPQSRIYAGDFETTSAEDYAIDGFTRVYLWHIRDIFDDTCTVGFSIEEFFGWFERMDCDNVMWFHNLAFDGSFMTDHALRIGMTSENYHEKKRREDSKKEAKAEWLKTNNKKEWSLSKTGKRTRTYVPKSVTEEYDTPPFSFSLIKAGGKWVTLTMINSRGFKLVLHDSGAKYTTCGSLADIAKAIGVEGKSDLDVSKRRGPDYMPGPEEIERVENDTRILAQAMRIMYERGLTSATLAGDAWKMWHSMYVNRVMEKEGCSAKDAMKTVDDYLFPKLNEKMKFPDGTVVDIRDAYYGGRVYLRNTFKEKDLDGISSIDKNSMYPSQMVQQWLPYGKPTLSIDKPDSWMYIVQFRCRFKVKKGMDPTIQRKQSFRSVQAEWVYESDPDGEVLTLSMIDYEMFLAHYDVEGLDLCTKYYVNFKAEKGEFFNEYIEKHAGEKKAAKEQMNICKENGDAAGWAKANADYYCAKILMNALYGKWGQNDVKPYQWVEMMDDRIAVKESDISKDEYFSPFGHKYLPMAIFITAWAREDLIRNFEMIPDAIYCDTDSVYYLEHGTDLKELGVNIHPSNLGAWDKECDNVARGRFIRPKTYMLDDGEKLKVKCGGMPAEVKKKATWDNFHSGYEWEAGTGKLLPKKVKGGTILKEVSYRMSE